MKKQDTEFILADETREIVAAYLAKRQKVKKPVTKGKREQYKLSQAAKK